MQNLVPPTLCCKKDLQQRTEERYAKYKERDAPTAWITDSGEAGCLRHIPEPLRLDFARDHPNELEWAIDAYPLNIKHVPVVATNYSTYLKQAINTIRVGEFAEQPPTASGDPKKGTAAKTLADAFTRKCYHT